MAEVYKVIVHSKAEKDLQETIECLKENVGYQTAEELQREFIETLTELTKRPASYSIFRPDQYSNPRFRKVILKKAWNLIFEIDEKALEVYVIRMLHVKRSTHFIQKNIK